MKTIIFSILVGFILWVVPAQADIKQVIAYKAAFPDSKPKCISCHKDEHPKKDDGQHDLNDYGKAVTKEAGTEKPTADTYKKVGAIPGL